MSISVGDKSKVEIIQTIKNSIIGGNTIYNGPFGDRKITYLDNTASNRSSSIVEDFIRDNVLPLYSNTHTMSSRCGITTTFFREEARNIIRNSVHASDDDVVLFCGSGSSSAVWKLVDLIGLERKRKCGCSFACNYPSCHQKFPDTVSLKLHERTHNDGDLLSLKIKVDEKIETEKEKEKEVLESKKEPPKVVVFTSIFEHHSNLLPWREYSDLVIEIPEDNINGGLNMNYLKEKLEEYKNCEQLIGSFCAASNVTGIVPQLYEITSLLHKYNALSFWDFANAFSHFQLDMNHSKDEYFDATFLSPHKMIGGPQTSGILVCKKNIIKNQIPTHPGGGTIFFVSSHNEIYTPIIEEREEGGTPGIVEGIRTGLVFQIRDMVGIENIEKIEQKYINKAIDLLSEYPNIEILGDVNNSYRVSILSFMIKHHNKYLHWNFICTLLNDLFGIQCRGGCMCAGPYSISLLGISKENLNLVESELINKNELLRPGYVRISFDYLMNENEFNFIIDAIKFVADSGYIFLPLYKYYIDTGEWKHISYNNKSPYRRWLNNLKLENGKLVGNWINSSLKKEEIENEKDLYMKYLNNANNLIETTKEMIVSNRYAQTDISILFPNIPPVMIWFLLPSDVYNEIKDNQYPTPTTLINVNYRINKRKARRREEEEEEVNGGEKDSDEPSHIEKKKFFIDLTPSPSQLQSSSSSAYGTCTTSKSISLEYIEELKSKGYIVEYHESNLSQHNIEYSVTVPGKTREEFIQYKKLHKELYPKPSKKLQQLVGKAVLEYNMINEGDRVAIGISGGKDSLSLLHLMINLQLRAPIKFELCGITVDPQTNGFDPKPLMDYCKSIGIEYHYESQAIIDRAKVHMTSGHISICSWCSRMKRGILYNTCRKYKYNVLVLAQHMDDLCESFMMSIFHNGILRTMKGNYTIANGDIRVIRPLIYVRESLTREYAKNSNLPIISENCPACFEGPKERYRVKTLLANQEQLFPGVESNILKAITPLIKRKTALQEDDEEL